MIPLSLTTERIALEDGSTAYPYLWRGEIVAVKDNAANVLAIIELYDDETTDADLKGEQIIIHLFADPNDAFCICDYDHAEFGRLIEAVTWDICGVDTGSRTTDKPLWDVNEDAPSIRTSLRMAYGIEWDTACGVIPFAEFIALIGGLPYETPLGAAMHYRNKANRPKPNKHNRRQVAEFDRLHRAFALKQKSTGSHDRIRATNSAMDDLALALVRKAG